MSDFVNGMLFGWASMSFVFAFAGVISLYRDMTREMTK